MRTYASFLVDSSRWARFSARPDDVIIATPAKCGTTWMQQLAGMLLLDRQTFEQPLSATSPWLDMRAVGEQQVFAALASQTHRRFIKTHTPLDGLPWHDSWTYVTVFRHPLDAALSYRDHNANLDRDHLNQLLVEAGSTPPPAPGPAPTDAREYLQSWIADEGEPDGRGMRGLRDYANSLRVAWAARQSPNVHLFHYDELWHDLGGQISRLATVLDVPLDPRRRAAFAEAATLVAMRSRARDTAPLGHDDRFWRDSSAFFRVGGRREWPDLLSDDEVAAAVRRLELMAGPEAARWALRT